MIKEPQFFNDTSKIDFSSNDLAQNLIDLDYFNAVNNSGKIKFWNGSTWELKNVKIWNGSAWLLKPLKFWNGTSFESTNN